MAKKKSTTRTIMPKKKGQKKITFKEGGLHRSMGIKKGKKMTAAQHASARSGSQGKRAKKQELLYENVLRGRGGRRRARSA